MHLKKRCLQDNSDLLKMVTFTDQYWPFPCLFRYQLLLLFQPIGIIWNMNNKRLEPKSDPRYTIREEILPGGVVSDLSIRRTERSDSALFTCVATNAFGSDDTSINMIVQGTWTLVEYLIILSYSVGTTILFFE